MNIEGYIRLHHNKSRYYKVLFFGAGLIRRLLNSSGRVQGNTLCAKYAERQR